jgi:thiol:disulfide interchange protein/DsbC/DsbD-like thiol-disulfide interchange protein
MSLRLSTSSSDSLFAVLCAIAPGIFALGVSAAPINTEHVQAELVAEKNALEPGQPFALALRLKVQEHWHTYWRNPGDSGLATKITWNLPAGYQAGPIQWPHPSKLPLGPLMNFGYEGEVFLLSEITPPATLKAGDSAVITAKAEWLVCKDVCIPENGELALTLPVSSTPEGGSRWQADFAAARAAQPAAPGDWRFTSAVKGVQAQITITPPAGFRATLSDLAFFPFRDNVMENAAPQALTRSPGGYLLAIKLAEPVPADLKQLSGVLVSKSGWGNFTRPAMLLGADPGQPAPKVAVVASPASPSPATPVLSQTPNLTLWLALPFAFIGGLILNLMPCVFPVLGIKVMSFIGQSRSERRVLRRQGLVFLAGVLVSFWVLTGLLLTLRAGGEALGWGFQLQSPGFVTALAILFLLMALNLFGVFEIGTALQSSGANFKIKSVYSEAFLTGILAAIVATPCTAPFMGAALGYTLSQPAAVSVVVFTAIALGMATPVVLLAFFPAGLKALPKPGPWMVTFKQLMAFPLFATVVWLAWVLGAQKGNDAVMQLLAGLLLITMAAWVYGRWAMAGSKVGYLATLLLVAGGIAFAWPDASTRGSTTPLANAGEMQWQPYSRATVERLRADGKPVFVDFTAAWCISCQVNKRIALRNNEVEKRFSELGVVLLKADWTTKDPAITAALAEFGRNAVPLYVLYSSERNAAPVLLPELLTPGIVLTELDKMKPGIKAAVR